MEKEAITEKTLNRIVRQFDKSVETLTFQLNKTGEKVDKLSNDAASLSTEIKEARSDINKLEKTIQGNGSKGLTTQVELNRSRISKIDSILNKSDDVRLMNNRGRWGFYTAIAVALLTGVTSIILQIINHAVAQ